MGRGPGEVVAAAVLCSLVMASMSFYDPVSGQDEGIDDAPDYLHWVRQLGGSVSRLHVTEQGSIYAKAENGSLMKISKDGELEWSMPPDWIEYLDFMDVLEGSVLIGDHRLLQKIGPDGSIRWEYEFPGSYDQFRVLDNGKIAAEAVNNGFAVLNSDGVEVFNWTIPSKELSRDYHGQGGEMGFYFTLDDEGNYNVMVKDPDAEDGGPSILYKLDGLGRELWNVSLNLDPYTYSRPCFTSDGDLVIYGRDQVTEEKTLVSIDDDGSPEWSIPLEAGYRDGPRPAPGGGVWFASDLDYGEDRLFLLDDDGMVKGEWGNVSTGYILFAEDGSAWVPVSTDDENSTLFHISGNGTTILKEELDTWIYSEIVAGPDGEVVFMGIDKFLYSASDDNGVERRFFHGILPSVTYFGPGWVVEPDIEVSPSGEILVGSIGVHAYDINGNELWKVDVQGRVTCVPIIGPDRSIIVGSRDHDIYCFDMDGGIKWRSYCNDSILATPLYDETRGAVYALGVLGNLNRFDENGGLVWRIVLDEFLYQDMKLGPDGSILVRSYSGSIFKVSPEGKLIWKIEDNRITEVDNELAVADDGTVAWITDDTLISSDGNGENLWDFIPHRGKVTIGPLMIDGKIIAGGRAGNSSIWVFDKSGNLLEEFDLGDISIYSMVMDKTGSVIIQTGTEIRTFDGEFLSEPFDLELWGGLVQVLDGDYLVYTAYDQITCIDDEGEFRWSLMVPGASSSYFDPGPLDRILEISPGEFVIAGDGLFFVGAREEGDPILPPEIISLTRSYPNRVRWDIYEDRMFLLSGFRLYRGESEEDLELLETLPGYHSGYSDEDTELNRTYYYMVESFGPTGRSARSSIIEILYEPYPHDPGPPLNITAEGKNGEVKLTWDPPEELYGYPLQGYLIYRIYGDEEWQQIGEVGPDVETFVDTNVTNGEYYHYNVAAFNEHGHTFNDTNVWARPHKELIFDDNEGLRLFSFCCGPLIFCGMVFLVVILYTRKRNDGYSWHDGKGEKFLGGDEDGG